MKKRINYTKDLLEPIVKGSFTWAEVCRTLGVKPMTGAQTYVKKRAVDFQLDSSHFTGQASNKGREFVEQRKDITIYLNNEASISSARLRLLLIRDGYKEAKCEICNGVEWMGRLIPLELDHIDSNHFNNKLENLQIVCPNCHALETVDRRNK